MYRKLISLALAFALLNIAAVAVAAKTPAEKSAERAAKVKRAVAKLGAGEKSLVRLRLLDGTKLEGRVSAVADDSFTVTDLKTGAATAIPYWQVGQAKGNNLSTGAKIAIGVGIAAAVVLILYLAADKDFSN
jgi:hypothetical protein